MTSRKLWLTVLFVAIVCGNAWFVAHSPLSPTELGEIIAALGVYTVGNVADKK